MWYFYLLVNVQPVGWRMIHLSVNPLIDRKPMWTGSLAEDVFSGAVGLKVVLGQQTNQYFPVFDYSSVNILLSPVDAAASVMDAFIKAE